MFPASFLHGTCPLLHGANVCPAPQRGSNRCWGVWELEHLWKWQSAWLHPRLAWMVMATVTTPLGKQREPVGVVCVSGGVSGDTEGSNNPYPPLEPPPPSVLSAKTRTNISFFLSHTHTQTQNRIVSIPDLKDFIVQIVLKGLAVFDLLLLLFQLAVSLGAGTAPAPGGGLVRVVPLLFFLAVQVRWCTRRRLHSFKGGVCWLGQLICWLRGQTWMRWRADRNLGGSSQTCTGRRPQAVSDRWLGSGWCCRWGWWEASTSTWFERRSWRRRWGPEAPRALRWMKEDNEKRNAILKVERTVLQLETRDTFPISTTCFNFRWCFNKSEPATTSADWMTTRAELLISYQYTNETE